MPDDNFGKIQVYTGNGKGKTTAALGLAGFASGPKILNTVGTPSSFLAGPAKRIAE